MKILVYGAGALGLLMGYYLKQIYNVDFVGRRNEIKKYKILKEQQSTEAIFNIKECIPNEHYDAVILATKSFDVDKAIVDILTHLPHTYIFTIQNGVYTEQKLLENTDRSLIFPISSFIGSNINRDVLEQFINNGQKLGYFNDKNKAVEFGKMFNDCGLKTTVIDNIMQEKWWKFMLYCSAGVLNALTQIRDFNESDVDFSSKIAQEIVEVFSSSVDFDLESTKKEFVDFIKYFKPEKWKASVGEDLKKGKKTEIEYLNGYVVTMANRFGKKVPYNESIFMIVKMLEKTGFFTKIQE